MGHELFRMVYCHVWTCFKASSAHLIILLSVSTFQKWWMFIFFKQIQVLWVQLIAGGFISFSFFHWVHKSLLYPLTNSNHWKRFYTNMYPALKHLLHFCLLLFFVQCSPLSSTSSTTSSWSSCRNNWSRASYKPTIPQQSSPPPPPPITTITHRSVLIMVLMLIM